MDSLYNVTIKEFHLTLHFVTFKRIIFANLVLSGSYSSISFTSISATCLVSCTRVSMFTSVKIGQMMWRKQWQKGQSPSKSCLFSSKFFCTNMALNRAAVHERFHVNLNPICWKSGKISLHLNSSKQAICYPLSFSEIDEQVVFRRSLKYI